MSLLKFLCPHVIRMETALLLGLLLVAGCGSSDPTPKPDKPNTPVTQQGPKVTPENSQPENSSPEPAKPDPEKIWAELAEQIKSQLAQDDLPAAQKSITALQQVYGETGPTDEMQQEELAGFQTGLAERARAAAHRFREERLQAGRELLDLGKFDESMQAIEVALARSPSDAQRNQAGRLKREIEYRRKVLRSLGALRKLLGSKLRSERSALPAAFETDDP